MITQPGTTSAGGQAASDFTLPLGWRDANRADAADRTAMVRHGDLGDGLRALAAGGSGLPAVLFTAHLAVLSLLTEDRVFQTDLTWPPHPPRPVRASPDASTWRALVAQVTEAVGLPEGPAEGEQTDAPDAASPLADRVLFQIRDAPRRWRTGPAPDRYGLRVVAGAQTLRLAAAAGAITRDNLVRLSRMYRTALVAMAADPDGDPLRAPLPRRERDAVLHRWSTGEATERGAASLIELFEAQADRTPSATAVVTAQGTLTYRELDRRANHVAHYLLQHGAGPETLVGVCLRRTPELLPVLLGVWKAGAGYLPLDPDLPLERRQRMVSSAGSRLVVTTTAHHGEHLVGAVREILLDRERPSIRAAAPTRPGVATHPHQLAYVIYTSGSTGDPKGVMVQQGGLRNYLLWTVEAYAARGVGGSAYFTPLSFDLGIPSLFTPLLAGQPVHLLPDPCPPADLGELLAAGAPYSFLKLTPGHLHLLSLDLAPDQAGSLAGLVIAAGDAFPTELATRWLTLAGRGGTPVATEYGPTEITIGNSGRVIGEPPTTELIPLGEPIPNTTMYVLTGALQPVPVGIPGEIYIGGTGVARGYLGGPRLTAERFVPDPYGPPGGRLYRTGDRARWLADGGLEFLGRIDNQVKIRGYRVELGEIQAALHRHATVGSAVVVPYRPPGRPARLAAFIIPAAGQRVDARTLQGALAAELPDYMVPTDFVPVEEIPLTANGKVDTRALQGLLGARTS